MIITPDTEFGLWETEGYWIIENEALKEWVYSLGLGGTEMLSEVNRQEIRDLVRQETVYFFSPQKYEELLFVGCWYDGGRGLGVAVYEPLADGYRLLKLIREDEVRSCASGSEAYYCDYQDLRIFLILNQNITGMEWSGDYEKACAIDIHPGLVVEYFPETLNAMYRFSYSGGATTMYMDWNNKTHGQPPRYTDYTLADPDDAYSVLSNLRLLDILDVWVIDTEEVDNQYDQAIAKSLSSRQTVDLLNILREIPRSGYTPAEFTAQNAHGLEIILGDPEESLPWITLTLSDGAFYYSYLYAGNPASRTWKIEDEALVQFTEKHLAEDTAKWTKFVPYPKVDGEISFTHGDWQITAPRLLCFQYEYTEAGIRFKPQEQTGWLELQYREEPHTPEEKGLKAFDGKYGKYDVIYGHYEGYEAWRYMDISLPDGEQVYHLLLLNEEGKAWVEEYGREITWLFDALVITRKG